MKGMKALLTLSIVVFSYSLQAQEIEVIKLPQLKEMMAAKNDHTVFFNFWASWCAPCVKEMPYLQQVDGTNNLEVVLISLDFSQDIEKTRRILEKKEIELKTYLLDETDYDKVIPAINKSWSGAIPATLVIRKNGERFFYEKGFEKEELEDIVQQHTTK